MAVGLPPERNRLDGESARDARSPLLSNAARLDPGSAGADTGAAEDDDLHPAFPQLTRNRESDDPGADNHATHDRPLALHARLASNAQVLRRHAFDDNPDVLASGAARRGKRVGQALDDLRHGFFRDSRVVQLDLDQ